MMQIKFSVTSKNNQIKPAIECQNWFEYNLSMCKIFIEEQDGFITKITFNKNHVSGNNFESHVIKIAHEQICEYLKGQRFNFDLPVKIYGTEFEIKVLKQLIKLPYAQTKSYSEIASQINCKSSQAVGGACANNPVAIVVPCHRVIAKNGNLTGFAGGLSVKKALLELEQNFKQNQNK